MLSIGPRADLKSAIMEFLSVMMSLQEFTRFRSAGVKMSCFSFMGFSMFPNELIRARRLDLLIEANSGYDVCSSRVNFFKEDVIILGLLKSLFPVLLILI